MNKTPKLITALDYPTAKQAQNLANKLDPTLTNLKIGKELFTAAGPQLVEQLQKQNFNIFLDLKFHDIPNTVAGALKAAQSLGVWMTNVHASGGRAMLEAARKAIDPNSSTLLIAVTVLTSMDQHLLAETGINTDVQTQVDRLATLTADCDLDGVVCSPRESTHLKQKFGKDFLAVTPGVRPAGSDAADQRRVMTPADALDAGSDYLVIGRPITEAPDPLQALQQISADIT